MLEGSTQAIPRGPGDLRELIAFSLRSLARMQHPSGIFCTELVAGDPVPKGSSLRYTLMSYIGLQNAQRTGYVHGFDLDRIRTAAFAALDASELRPGDFGLYLWADALTGGDRGAELMRRLARALAAGGDLNRREGMEIAWIVKGLALQVAVGAGEPARRALGETLDRALARQDAGSGLFAHTQTGPRRRFPNFATQIYHVLALATVAKLELDRRARDAARRAGERLLEAQLSDGGWPWLYDSGTGRVVERYEIYAVHQDAMAPMGLLELAEATGERAHARAAGHGLEWIYGANELGRSMFDPAEDLLYRSIRRTRPRDRLALYRNTAAAVVGRSLDAQGSHVELNRTDRPYHLGWVLEAWCGRESALA